MGRFLFSADRLRPAKPAAAIPAALLMLALLAAPSANATLIQYDLADLGGGTYEYTYSVLNDGSLGAGVPIEGFTLSFDVTLYDDVTLTITTPSPLADDWDELIFPGGPGFPALYDVVALAGGIADGTLLGGFSVRFIWLGIGLPGAQEFDIYDPLTFDILETGSTSPYAAPEPPVLGILILGLLALRLTNLNRLGRSQTCAGYFASPSC